MVDLCHKCNMRYMLKGFEPYCYICGLKIKGFYNTAIRELKNSNWWNYYTNWDFKIGWSFVRKVLLVKMFKAVLNAPSMNKTPKAPYPITDFFSQWQIDIANEHYKIYY